MGEIYYRAKTIFLNREKSLKDFEKKAEEEYKNQISKICDLIFDIFDTNISEPKRHFAVWDVKLVYNGDNLKCMLNILPPSENLCIYKLHSELLKNDKTKELANNITTSIAAIENVSTKPTIIKDIYDLLLDEKIGEYYTLEIIAADELVVRLKLPN